MKKFKKLIPALCMLLVSAILLGGSTFAWFSMNNEVTANGMQVSAKSNTQFLIIEETAAEITNTTTASSNMSVTATKTSGGIGGTTNNVYPSARATEANKPVSGLAIGDWYTGNSKLRNDAGAAGTTNFVNGKKIETADLGNYVLTYEFYIGLAKGSEDYTGGLVVTNEADALANGVTAVINVGTQTEIVFNDAKNTDNTTITNINLKANVATKVTVQLYIDGNNAAVKTEGFTSITGTLNLAFQITPTV